MDDVHLLNLFALVFQIFGGFISYKYSPKQNYTAMVRNWGENKERVKDVDKQNKLVTLGFVLLAIGIVINIITIFLDCKK